MEQENQVTNQTQSLSSQMSSGEKTAWERAIELVEKLCLLFSYYRNSIKSTEDHAKIVKIWFNVTSDLTDRQINVGKHWLKNSGVQFCPEPLYFRRKCFGLIDSDRAFEIAKTDKYYNQAIYGAASQISTMTWKRLADVHLRRQFLIHYADVCEKIMQGAKIFVPDKKSLLESKPDYYNKPRVRTKYGEEQSRKLRELCATAKKNLHKKNSNV